MVFEGYAQRGKIIKPASGTTVLDPNGDGFVSVLSSGFSNDGYNVDEFEIPMFGLPKSASGEVLNDIQAGANCGTTELTYDNRGYSVYGVLNSGHLIFRFRVANDRPSVEAYSILIDTDGNIGTEDPNSTAQNPGFEIDITLIKNNSKGVYVYNIDGIESCPTELLHYDLSSHFQISVADEVSCSDPDYFYDFYVPFADIASAFSVSSLTEMRFVALTNVSATCAMSGKISDIGGVDDTAYNGCNACAFLDLGHNQCPTSLVNLCPTCSGFRIGFTPRPTINAPLKAGALEITGGSVANAEVYLKIFDITKTLKERDTIQAAASGAWAKTLLTPLAIGDSVTAQAKGVGQCNSGGISSGTSFTIVIENTPPTLAVTNNSLSYLENGSPLPIAPGLTISDPDNQTLESATIQFTSAPTLPEDVLTYASSSGISVTYNSATGSLSLTGTATVAAYQTLIRSVSYSNSSDDPQTAPREFSVIVYDGYDDSNELALTLGLTAVNDPPVLTSPSNIVTYAGAGLTVNGSFSITDLDNATLQAASMSFSNNFANAEDALSFSNQNGITGIYDNTTGTLTLTGDATLAQYATALSSVQYSNSNGSPSQLTRRLSINVNDGISNSNTFLSFIDFPGGNSPPVIVDDNDNPIDDIAYTINEDTPLDTCVTANDPDGDPLMLQSFTNVAGPGTFVIKNDLCFEYTPPADFNGTITATIRVCDQTSGSLCDAANITIVVLPVNDPPVINETTWEVDQGVQKEICVSYSDIEGDPAIFNAGTSRKGSVALTNDNTDPCFIYTPDPDFVGRDTLTVTICDPNDPVVCSSGNIYIDVIGNNGTPGPDPNPDPDQNPGSNPDPDPNTNPDDNVTIDNRPPEILINGLPGDSLYAQVDEDSALVVCFEAIDPDGNDVTLSQINKLTTGGGNIALYQNIEFCMQYTPLENFNGRITWGIIVCDNQTPSLCGTVKLVLDVLPVNDRPEPFPDTIIVTRNVQGSIDLLLNDRDIDGDELTVSETAIQGPQHGQFSLSSDGTLTYLSDRYYKGPDEMIYEVCDSGVPSLCSQANALILIDDAPFKAYEAFSPNGDGLNDYWRIEGIDFYPNNVVQVFDRYNNLVFELRGYNNENKMWRGETNHGLVGGKLPEGIYYYAITLGDGERFKGFVMLKRE